MRTFSEIQEYLADHMDEITLLELLKVNSRDLVERFSDILEDMYDELVEEYGEP